MHLIICLLILNVQGENVDSIAQALSVVNMPEAMQLLEAYPIESEIRPELSGLTYVDGKLLTVSDKHQGVVFSIVIQDGSATLESYVDFCSPGMKKMDLEGLTSDKAGNLYLLSERQNRILCLPKESNQCFWFTPSLTKEGNKENLLLHGNTGFEGLAFQAPNVFVASAERQDRGLISWTVPDMKKGGIESLVVLNCDESIFSNSKNRNLDFTGLCFHGEKLVALQRNNHLISVVSGFRSDSFAEEQAWSYAHVENDPRYRYSNRKYGLAEGICIVGDRIYIVLDNNKDTREVDSSDRRPLLLIFKKPAEL